MFDVLHESNVLLYAIKHYDNPNCENYDEFVKDYEITRHIMKLLRRYKNKDEARSRLLLNHIILFFNIFTEQAAVRLLFYKIDNEFYPQLKALLLHLNRCPQAVQGVDGTPHNLNVNNIIEDNGILEEVKE